MTDGAEETTVPPDSQGSHGSVDEIIQHILQTEEEYPDLFSLQHTGNEQVESSQFANTDAMRMDEISQLFDLNIDGSAPANVQPCQTDQVPVKQELQTVGRSPDSGYQPPSNGSYRSVADVEEEFVNQPTARYGAPAVVSAKRPMFEIEPQSLFNPPRSDYLGNYGFRISFERRDSVPKNINYTHSYALNKLFVKMDVPCPVKFHCSAPPPEGAVVRGTLHFMEHVHEIVSRCYNHMRKEANDEMKSCISKHVLQAAVQQATYPDRSYPSNNNLKGLLSVVVPYIPAEPGDDESFKILYKFMCLSTCPGGINRRAMMAVFTLEDLYGSVLGRACVEVKVCSCPGRDRPKEEEKGRTNGSGSAVVSVPLPKKRAREEHVSVSGYKYLKVKEKHFKVLSVINDALNLSDMVPEGQQAQYHEEAQKHLLTEQLAKFYKDDS